MGPTPAPADGFPRPFGSYLLLSAFAKGGMGEVYLAKTGGIEGIERVCVLKKLRPDFGDNKEYVNRFLDEARLVVQLSHANIAHVFDVGRVGNEYYLAMEYVSGVSLKALMARAFERGQPVPPDVALYVLCEVLLGLDYAHRLEHPVSGQPLHLVHRDISPHNVMVSYEGEVKLIDFGLAESELKVEQTESQIVMGKVAYMSPEQARGEHVTGRCDQFAAAVVIYELLAHDRFYGEMSNYQIWQVVGRGGFTPRRWASLDPALQRILSRALHGDPAQRFESCGDFREALLEYLVKHHPQTNRRAVREYLGAIFAADLERERAFLQKMAAVSAASVRAAKPAVDASAPPVSLVHAEQTAAPAPKPPRAPAPKPVRAAEEVSGTHVLERKRDLEIEPEGSSGPNKALVVAAGLALLLGSATASFFVFRALKTASAKPRAPVAAVVEAPPSAAPPAREAPREEPRAEAKQDEPPPPEPAQADEPPSPSPDEKPAEAEAPDENASAAVAPAPKAGKEPRRTDPRRSSPKDSRSAPERSQTTTAATASAASTSASASPTTASASEKRADEGTRPPPEPNAPPPSARDAEAEAWRKRVVRRLERCPPCAKTFLERAKLHTLPASKLTDEVRLSVQACLKQCEAR